MAETLYAYKAFRFFANHGLRKTIKRTAYVIYQGTVVRFMEWRFDRRFGTETGGQVHWPQGSAVPLHRFASPYEATSPKTFNRIMQSIGCLTAPFTFIDVGCGKGRVLLMAAHCAFARVIGIEFDPDLALIAKNNAAKFHSQAGRHGMIDVVCDDAARYQFPDENAVIFLFNPFKQEIMKEVLKNIRLTANATKHRYIIYQNPVLESLFADPNEFSLVRKEKKYVIYRMRFND